MRGQAPLTPCYAADVRSHSHTPRGEPRRGGERPWPHRYPIPVPSFSFLTSMISPKQKIQKKQRKRMFQINRSNRSFFALQTGQISGGWSRAQRYPQTAQRHTGNERVNTGAVDTVCTGRFLPRSDLGGLRSGTGAECSFPSATGSFT
jgi:hypothetical protein